MKLMENKDMKLTAVLLIVLTNASDCSLNSIDHADPTYVEFKNMEDCKSAAQKLDEKLDQRAFCVDVNKSDVSP